MKTSEPSLKQLCRASRAWPTPRELADEYGLPERFVRAVVERREVETIKLDLIRVNPASWEAWVTARYVPGIR